MTAGHRVLPLDYTRLITLLRTYRGCVCRLEMGAEGKLNRVRLEVGHGAEVSHR